VQQGEDLVSIAERYGFFWETLWNLGENSGLHEGGREPTALTPGDEVYVPDRVIKSYTRATGARHTFQAKNVPARLRLRLALPDDSPRSGVAYTLVVDGKEHKGTTGGDGMVDVPIHPNAQHGRLQIDGTDEHYDLELGHLEPLERVDGVQARLRGLGVYRGPIDGEMTQATRHALMEFQRSVKLAPTGEIDGATRQALQDAYGI
jgi:hypothetical protein